MKRYREMVLLCMWVVVVVACGSPSVVEHGNLPTNQHHSAQSKDTKPSHSGQNSAEEGRTNGTEKEGKESPIQKLDLPPDLKRAVEEAGMPIYEGSEPPNVEGKYRVRSIITASKGGRLPDSRVYAVLSLLDQTQQNTVLLRDEGWGVTGKGWIVGRDNRFTIYTVYNFKNIPGKVCFAKARMTSGIKKGKELHTISFIHMASFECSGIDWEKTSGVWTPMEENTPEPGQPDDPGEPSNPPVFPIP